MRPAQKFWLLLLLNLLAAYLPGEVWVNFLPRGSDHFMAFLFSPVSFVLVTVDAVALWWGALALFLLGLVILSAGLCWIRSTKVLIPLAGFMLLANFVYSVVQGLMFLPIIIGLSMI